MPSIHTLVDDIYRVVEGKGGWDKTITDYLSETIATVAEERFSNPRERNTLSLSGLGNPCQRELWLKVNSSGKAKELTAEAKGTFFYGDLLEALVIALAKAAGHTVEGEQDELKVNGIKGHRDCIIDGWTVDIKSASKYSFDKFASGKLRENDPFGYISQLSSYVYAGQDDPLVVEKKKGAFLVVKKDRFSLCLDVHDFTEDIKTKEEEVQQVKDMVDGEIPDRMSVVPQSKTSPNTKLDIKCQYCSFIDYCWPEKRTFYYSTGPLHLVDVVKEPRVPEAGRKIW